ncbi:hypothetical protein HY572_02240 [Candidatus Micrarchaeota archaeon]|nr:hypothetical protein [Candidatus Micrarchaeota archaeon]
MADLKEQYEAWMTSLEEKGIPQPRLLVPLLVVVIAAGLLFYAVPNLFTPQSTVTFTVQNEEGQAVPNAAVELTANTETKTSQTDALGKVSFTVPADQRLRVKVTHSKYEEYINNQFSYTQSQVRLQAKFAAAEQSYTVQVVSDQGSPLQDALVVFSLDDGTSRIQTTDALGQAQINVNLPNHISIKVTKEGYKTEQESVAASDQSPRREVTLRKIQDEKPQTRTVTQLVRVEDQNGNAVDDVRVTLLDETTQIAFDTAYTDAFGQSRFDDVDASKRFTVSVVDDRERFSAYATPFAYTASNSEAITVRLTAVQREKQLQITVKDDKANSVADATVRVYDRAKKHFISSKATDSAGKAVFQLEAESAYVTVYSEGFLPEVFFAKNTDEKTVTLKSAEGATVQVEVTVQKQLDPQPNADVQLFSSDGFPLGVPEQATGTDGIATFQIPRKNQGFYAEAALGLDLGRSDIAVASNDAELFIHLESPKATLKVNVRDAGTKQKTSQAVVRLVDSTTKAECTTTNGSCTLNVPTDVEFRVLVEHPQYLPYQSALQFIPAGTPNQDHDVALYPKALTDGAAVSFQGFFTSEGQRVHETGNAQRLEARFAVTLPVAKPEDAARFTVWVGQNDVDQNNAGILSVDGPDSFYTGTTPLQACNPSENLAEDLGLAQWAVFDFPNGFSGTQQVILDVFVKPDAKASDDVVLEYRLHGIRNNLPVTVPLDAEKLQSLLGGTVTDADFCGAKTQTQKLPIAKDVLTCDENLCQKAVFETADGTRLTNAPEITLGQTFTLDLAFVGLQSGVAQVTVDAPESVDLLSLQPLTPSTNANNSELATNRLTLPLDAAAGEKAELQLKAKAVRATPFAELLVTVQDVDGFETEIRKNVLVSGTNRFSVQTNPEELEAGLQQLLRVTVKDQLQRPIEDAVVTLYECDGVPLNGQELEITENQNGVYTQRMEPSSLGIIGVRVQHIEFKTFDECILPVTATDFLEAEPESLTLTGDTKTESVTEKITVSSLIDVKSKLSSTISCSDENDEKASAPFTVSPKALTLKDTATVDLTAKKTTFKGRCDVVFTAKANNDNIAAAIVAVQVDLKGPPKPEELCPQTARCLPPSDGRELRCTASRLLCDDETLSCFQCNLGPQTIPSQISLSVSNFQSDDVKTFAVALEDQPEECRVEGFKNNPALSPYGPSNPYSQNPFQQYQNPYYSPYQSTNFNYWNYQPNGYQHYPTNPFDVATPEERQGDFQSLLSQLSPYCQRFLHQYTPYNAYQNYYGTNYQDPWNTQGSPYQSQYQYPQTSQYQYSQNRPTVSVTATCTRTEIVVSAQYTGGDQQFGAGLGGQQRGILLVRAGGQTKQVPVTVQVQTPSQPGFFPQGYPTSQIPPQCLYELQQLQQKQQTQEEGLDASGLPDAIDVYYNKYTGKGGWERELKPPQNAQDLQRTQPTGSKARVTVGYTGNKLRVDVQCPVDKEGAVDCGGTAEFQATWRIGQVQQTQKKRTIRFLEDPFSPAVLQLVVGQTGKDAAQYSVQANTDFSKAKCQGVSGVTCSGDSITATTSTAINKDLEISGTDDFAIRFIPVRASTIQNRVDINLEDKQSDAVTIAFQPKLLVEPTCEPDEKLKTVLTIEKCTKDGVVLKAARPPSTEPVSGTIKFSFADSVRATTDNPPSITVVVTRTEPKRPTINSVEPRIAGQESTIVYTFPDGSDAEKSKITVTLKKTDGTDAGTKEFKKADGLAQSGSIKYTPQVVGTLNVQAVTEINGKEVKSDVFPAEITVKEQAQTTDTTTPGKSTDSGILSNLQVSKPSGPVPMTITATFAGEKTTWKKYVLSVQADASNKITPFESQTKDVDFSGTTFTLKLYPNTPAITSGAYDEIKTLLEKHGKATFTLEALDASNKVIGKSSIEKTAADLGFTASTAPTSPSAPGTTTGAYFVAASLDASQHAVVSGSESVEQRITMRFNKEALDKLNSPGLKFSIHYSEDLEATDDVIGSKALAFETSVLPLTKAKGTGATRIISYAFQFNGFRWPNGKPAMGKTGSGKYYVKITLVSEGKTVEEFEGVDKTSLQFTIAKQLALDATSQILEKNPVGYPPGSYIVLLTKKELSSGLGPPVTLEFGDGATKKTLALHYLYYRQAHVSIFSGEGTDSQIACGYYWLGRGSDMRLETNWGSSIPATTAATLTGIGVTGAGVLHVTGIAGAATAGTGFALGSIPTIAALIPGPGWAAIAIGGVVAGGVVAYNYFKSDTVTCGNAGLKVTLKLATFPPGATYETGWKWGRGYENARVVLIVSPVTS